MIDFVESSGGSLPLGENAVLESTGPGTARLYPGRCSKMIAVRSRPCGFHTSLPSSLLPLLSSLLAPPAPLAPDESLVYFDGIVPIEIEAKMRLPDVAALEARLTGTGALRGPVIEEFNRFFDTPQHSLRSAGEGLRIRIERSSDRPEPVAIITHKGPRAPGQLKTRHETELRVDDPDGAASLLGALGFVAVLSFEKRRARWMLEDCRVEIDELPHLGHFVEIEGPAEQRVLELRRTLELDTESLITQTYAHLVEDYLSAQKVESRHLGFD